MAALDVTNYKHIHQSTKDLINGFIRGFEALFSNEHSAFNIPVSINYICALFYYLTDEWNKDRMARKYEISDDKLTLSSTGKEGGSDETCACLTAIARSGQNHWKFKIDKWPHPGTYDYVVIGVIKENANFDKVISKWLGGIVNTTYCWDMASTELNVHNSDDSDTWIAGYGVKGKEGDIIDMYLDLDKYELSFAVNGKNYGKSHDVDKEYGYIGIVSFRYADYQMTLLSYDFQTYSDEI